MSDYRADNEVWLKEESIQTELDETKHSGSRTGEDLNQQSSPPSPNTNQALCQLRQPGSSETIDDVFCYSKVLLYVQCAHIGRMKDWAILFMNQPLVSL